jgi:hypothetical protein
LCAAFRPHQIELLWMIAESFAILCSGPAAPYNPMQ